jgi:signal transduction histidine kinase
MSYQPDSREIGRLGVPTSMLMADLPAAVARPATQAASGPSADRELTPLPDLPATTQSAGSGVVLGTAVRRLWRSGEHPSLQPSAGSLARFTSTAVALRWGALAVAFGLAAATKPTLAVWVSAGVLGAYAAFQTLWPTHYERGGLRTLAPLLLEVSIGAAAVEFTGLERSPFLLCLGVATLVAGHAGSLRIVPGLIGIACLSVLIPSFVVVQDRANAGEGVQFATLLLLVGLVGSYSRHLLEDAGRVGQGLVSQMEQLSDVNDLLLDLHAASERVPMPLELQGAVAWVLERMDEAFGAEISVVALRDPSTDQWRLEGAKGLRGHPGDAVELASVVAVAARGEVPLSLGRRDQGLDYTSTWGIYAPMIARNEVVGLLAVESRTPRISSEADERRLKGIASAGALAIDNARWLERIHTFGVEQERSRLARELHDHVGQSMMYLGLELDRLVKVNHGRAVAEDLQVLRKDVRTLVEELRDTLVDLRTDVSAERDVASVLETLAERVNRRARLKVECSFDVARRLAIPVEREIWRIAQEAVVNAERHARAQHVKVVWVCHQKWALLEVSDDGVGLPVGAPANQGSYGMIGMRERADAIGAQLEVTSEPGSGTTVRMRLKVG